MKLYRDARTGDKVFYRTNVNPIQVEATPADAVEAFGVDVLLAAIGEKRALEWALTEPCPPGVCPDGGLVHHPVRGRVWRERVVEAAGRRGLLDDTTIEALAYLLDAAEDV